MVRDISEQLDGWYRAAFYVAVALFVYGTLFPFRFDFSPAFLAGSWSGAKLLPYWDTARGRISSIPDMVSNLLLGMPLGCFGFWLRDRSSSRQSLWRWGLLGLTLGLSVEALQLAIPSRTCSLTDAINDGLGAFIGALAAKGLKERFLPLVTVIRQDPARIQLFLILCILIFGMLGPLDVTLDVSQMKSALRAIWVDPWESRVAMGDTWIFAAEFAIWGALGGRLLRAGKLPARLPPALWIAGILALPFFLEMGQVFVASHAPSLRELTTETLGAAAGLGTALARPPLTGPRVGLILLATALAASGFSPYHFVGWDQKAPFQWIPLYEYYVRTTASSLYDAVFGIVSFGLLAVLLRASCSCSRWFAVGAAIALASAIELGQMFLPTRYPGITDILMAALGAWTGATFQFGAPTAAEDVVHPH